MARLIPKQTDKRPAAAWASGKEVLDLGRIHRGWFIDAGLDAALDDAAAAAGWPCGQMEHLDGAVREHWLLPAPTRLYVLIQGVPYTTVGALARNDISYSGVGCRWVTGSRSKLGVQALPDDLVQQGYLEPLPFSVSSTFTDDLLAALLAHNAVLDACEQAAVARGKPRSFEFWEVALPLAAGERVVRGRDQTTTISPIACTHPDSPNLPYLRSLLAPKVVADVVGEQWDAITSWAADYARGERTAAMQEGVAC